MGSPLSPTLADSFLCYPEKRRLHKCPEEFKSGFYRRYVDNMFVLFRKEEQLKLFLNHFSSCHENIKFTSKKEISNKLSFVDMKYQETKNSLSVQFTVSPHLVEYSLTLIVSFLEVINST